MKYNLEDINDLIGKQFTVNEETFKTKEDEYFKGTVYTICQYNGLIKIIWDDDNENYGHLNCSKEELIDKLNKNIWILKETII